MAYEYITSYNCPNYWDAGDLAGYAQISIESITIHHWDDPARNPTFWGTVTWVCRAGGTSSAHEVIEAGRVAHLINMFHAAWHSGTFEGNTESYSLELNPRASDGDYATAAERIADLWHALKRRVPLVRHKDWYNTACPGRYDIGRLTREANAWFDRKYNGKKADPIMAKLDKDDYQGIAEALLSYPIANKAGKRYQFRSYIVNDNANIWDLTRNVGRKVAGYNRSGERPDFIQLVANIHEKVVGTIPQKAKKK